jgi:hypothetical protein
MRSERALLRALAFAFLATAGLAGAAEKDEAPPAPPAPPPSGQREYEAQPLPDDTFKPSEEVSEDYPVPFPVDI